MGKKIKSFREICKLCRKLQKKEKKVVFCHGFFDVLHRGHIALLVKAKRLGDILVVGVDNDNNAKVLKGPKRPINTQESRALVVSYLKPVDFVFIVPNEISVDKGRNFFREGIYKKLQPNTVATCTAATQFSNIIRKTALEAGINFVDVKGDVYNRRSTKGLD